jgi:ATP-binding cassette subfamily B protein
MKTQHTKREINYRENLREYYKFLKPYLPIVIFLLILVSAAEIFLLSDKFLFKYIIDYSTNFSLGELSKADFVNFLLIIAGIYVGIQVAKVIFDIIDTRLNGLLTNSMQYDIKTKYFNHIIALDHNFHTTHKSGSLISRLNRCASAIDKFNEIIIWEICPFILEIILVSGTFFYFSGNAGFVLLGFCVVYIIQSYIVSRKQKSYAEAENKASDSEKAVISDMFTNLESIKYFGKEKYVNKNFDSYATTSKEKGIAHWNYWAYAGSIGMVLISIFTALMVYLPVSQLIRGEISVGTISLIYMAFLGLLTPLRKFSWAIRHFSRSLMDMDDLFSYGRISNAIKDKKNAEEIKITKGEIEFNDVEFRYNKQKLFKNFNLKIKQNEKIALVGHSGCGKTSLIKILYRFYDVLGGEILIDGKNIQNVKQESLRKEMSIVPQEPILFDDTIYNNIKFSNPKANRKEVLAAMKFAQLDKVVSNFSEKENTVVGERGIKLSGGEKQRVSIARAILANKKILVLDEATSALDSQTEFEIQKDLKRLMEGRTSIVIAHRLSTIMNADRIIVMDKGKIIENGKHSELIAKKGAYYKLWNLQKGGYI